MSIQRLDWYVVRASGLVAWGLVSASVLYGLAHSMGRRRALRRPRPAWSLDLHRALAAMACAATGLHLVTLWLDRFVGFGVAELFVPFAGRYRAAGVAWGIGATYLLVLVELTSLFRAWRSRRWWHALHLLSFVVFASTTVHALTAGTDRQSPFVVAFAVAVSSAAVALTAARVAVVARAHRATARTATAARRVPRPATLGPLDAAIDEVVRRGATRSRRVARHGHHRDGVPRSTPR